MRKIYLLFIPFVLLPSAAFAQCTGQAGPNTVCSNNTGSQALPKFNTLTPGTIVLPGGTVLANPTTSSAVGVGSTAPILGIPGTSTGQIGFAGSGSGTATIVPQAATGSPTLTLPNVSGTFAVGATSPLVLNATTGNLTLPGLAGGVLAGSGPAFSRTPVLGVPSTAIGTLGFAGNSSGTATITPQAAAGSPTLTLPNTSGTFAVGASSPVVLNNTTGNLTCPTCVTSSGGGAITGTAPINVTGAGVVSLQGANGTIAQGSGGTGSSFTATPVLGVAGTTVGSLGFQNASTGTVTIQPATGALGAAVATLPAGTYNLVGDSLTQALTNKTYNGLTVSTTTGTLTIANGKTATISNSLSFSGTDTKALVLTNGLTVNGNDGTLSFGAASKTLTTNNSITLAGTDSTIWTGPSTNATLASLNIADQTVTGGANVTTQTLSTGNVTIDCGSRPLQSITNGGAFTITAPANDGSCIVLVTNNASAGAIAFSGFNVGTNTGDALTTTNTNKFMISVARIAGSSTYSVKALQ